MLVPEIELGKHYKATMQGDFLPYTVAWQGIILQMHVSAIQAALAKCHKQLISTIQLQLVMFCAVTLLGTHS